MRRSLAPGVLAVIGLLAVTAAPAQASDASVRAALATFQPKLALAGKGFASALKGTPSQAAYTRLDTATLKYLATLKFDKAYLSAQHATTPKVAAGRAKVLTALTRLSQSATHLDKAIQAAKVGNKPAALKNARTGLIELRRAITAEAQAAALLHK